MEGIKGITSCQRGQFKVLQFEKPTHFTKNCLRSPNNIELLHFVTGRQPRNIAYTLDIPNIYLGRDHYTITSRHPELGLEQITQRLEDDKSKPIVMGWLCLHELPRARSSDIKELGLSKKNRTVLFVDGFSDLFRSIGPSRVSQDYYSRQTQALAFFPSILARYNVPYPTALIEQFSANQVLRVSHISRQKAWKIVRNGYLLEIEGQR
jgi:hypothetical protein